VRFSFLVSSLMAVALAGTVLAGAVLIGLVPTGPGAGPTSTLAPASAPASGQVSQPTPTATISAAPSPTASATPVLPSAGGTYVVQEGDTLTGIAGQVGVPWQLIAQANDIQGPDYIIQVGEILTIPVAPSISPNPNAYVVKPNDTITSIAQQFNVNPTDLADYNNIANWNDIKVGQVLYIPGPGWTPLPTASP
jgi:LysM repeat protein